MYSFHSLSVQVIRGGDGKAGFGVRKVSGDFIEWILDLIFVFFLTTKNFFFLTFDNWCLGILKVKFCFPTPGKRRPNTKKIWSPRQVSKKWKHKTTFNGCKLFFLFVSQFHRLLPLLYWQFFVSLCFQSGQFVRKCVPKTRMGKICRRINRIRWKAKQRYG